MSPGMRFTGECAAGDREVLGGLPVRVDAPERVRVTAHGVPSARARVEQHPQESSLIFGAPAHIVEHHGLVQPLGLEQPLHQLHGDEVALISLRGGDDHVAVALWPANGIEQPFGEIRRRPQRHQTELILPTHAVGFEFAHQVEHGQVVPQLFPRGVFVEVVRPVFAPVELHAAFLYEGHRTVESVIGDGTAPVDDPGLVDFVFRESDGSQPARAKVAVDHPHGRIPEHQGQNPSFPDLLGDAPRASVRLFGYGNRIADLLGGVADATGAAATRPNDP